MTNPVSPVSNFDLKKELIETLSRSGECSISGSAFPVFSVCRRPDGKGGTEDCPAYFSEVNDFLKSLHFPVKAEFSYTENKVYLERI